MFKTTILFIGLFLFALITNGQNYGDIKYPRGFADVTDVVKVYNGGTCGTTAYDIGGGYFKIKFISDIDGSNYLVEVMNNKVNSSTTDNYADVNNQYCITKNDYDNLFSKSSPSNCRTAYGILAVPFKLRFNPTTVAPGGELGGFYGCYIKNSNWLFAAHAGLTSISLNNIDAETPENKIGFTGGIALINDLGENFQVGIVTGVDVFDGVDEWTYGYAPWLSLQIGFKFTKSK
ncbi:MAG: hypothetical protein AB7S69_16750 [Salinivirgaceae bacterium]